MQSGLVGRVGLACHATSWHGGCMFNMCLQKRAAGSWQGRAVPERDLQRIAQQQEQASSRAPRFYVPPGTLNTGFTEMVIEGEEARHALRVLRLRAGDRVELCDGRGHVVLCDITSANKGRTDRAWVAPTAPVVLHPWRGPVWCLAVACTTLKGGRAEWLVEKATELGAAELIPVITERSQPSGASKGNKYKRAVSPDDEADYQPSRLERVAIAATKQCLREHSLQISPPLAVQEVAETKLKGAERVFVAVAGAPHLANALSQGQQGPGWAADGVVSGVGMGRPRVLLVGPEGDWTPGELQMLIDAGAQPVGLGSNRLRTETAAIALLSAVSLWQEHEH